ncbi:MAG: PH domain-containing protein [Burkholderiaceae bacterium]|nr:PH domain-containing protein [Microbacteriaceae bacterium]
MTDPDLPSDVAAPRHPAAPVTALAAALSDGDWHRLHPASPLLKGGIALIAIIGVVISNLRERLIEMFIPDADYTGGDPIDLIVQSGFVGWALLAVLGVLLVLVGIFYVSWRMHTFRITNEVVEVRSGVVFRTNRKARLDRIQGINIVRPFFARLFGAAKLEVNQAGQDANVKLEYLSSAAADALRREILRLASGTRATSAATATQAGAPTGVIDRRMGEFLAPELDPDAAPPASVVKLGVGRLLGSIVLSGASVFIVIAGVAVILSSIWADAALIGLFALIPGIIGVVGFYAQRFLKSLRYSIAGTPDGVRVGFGLLSTSNETLPPGRIHSVKVSQPLLWRPFDWWEVKVNRASHSSTNGAAGQQNTTILPVGNLDDVRRVLELVLPDFLDQEAIALAGRGLTGRGTGTDGYTVSPPRAAVLRWFSWRRNGFAVAPAAVLLRKGAIWRELIIVPHPRVQSVSMAQGPILRRLRLASVHVHTVAGPISAQLGAIDAAAATEFFTWAADAAVRASSADTSHRWRAAEPVVAVDAHGQAIVPPATSAVDPFAQPLPPVVPVGAPATPGDPA